MADEAAGVYAEYGVRAFKVKVGRDPALDIAAVAAIRDALPDALLYADANRGWTPAQAMVAGDALVGLGVEAIEEPIAIEDLRGRKLLAERWDVPLAGDESCLSLADVRRAIAEGAVGQVSVKVARTGFSESRDVLGLCRAERMPVVIGSQYEGALGALASIAFGAAFADTASRPVEATNFRDLAADLLAELPRVADGHVAVPTAPGLGYVIDEDALAAARTEA
jgi:L-alanine-DL-glutamate epimerase-like enolase superfamily enzyme